MPGRWACRLVALLCAVVSTLAAPPRDVPDAYTTYRKYPEAPVAFVKDPFAEHLGRRSGGAVLKRIGESSAAEPVKYIWNALEPVGDWHNESNWMPHGTPGPFDLAVISALGGKVYVTISADVAVGAFEIGAGVTLNVTNGAMFKFTNRSLVDVGALLYVGTASTMALVELDVYGTLDVIGDYRAYPYTYTCGTVVIGINPLPGDAAPVTPTNVINVFGTTNLLGLAGVHYINVSNVVIVNNGHLHMGSAANGTFLQIWMLDYMVINNTATGLFDMQQGPADTDVSYYYVLAGWLAVVKVINSGTWILGKIHVSTVNQEHHGPVIWLPGGVIDGASLTGSKFTWNFTTPDAGVSCGGFVVDVEEWTLVGPGGIRFMMNGLGVGAFTRFHTGRLVAHTEVDLVSVKISSTFDFRTFPETVVRLMRWDDYGGHDNMANEIDTVAFVNHGTLILDADSMSGKDDLVQLLNGATIVNEANRVMNWISKVYNLTVTSPDGSGGYVNNRGGMNVTYAYNKYNPALQVPLVSSGTISVLSGNFTAGAGLSIDGNGNYNIYIAQSARLAVSGQSQADIYFALVSGVGGYGGVFAQLDESFVNISSGLLLRDNIRYEWYGGQIGGQGLLSVLSGATVTTMFPPLKTMPTFTARLDLQGTFNVRGPFQVTDGSVFGVNKGTVNIATAGLIWFTPTSLIRHYPSSNWNYFAYIAANGTTMVCPTCY